MGILLGGTLFLLIFNLMVHSFICCWKLPTPFNICWTVSRILFVK